jgi:uridylate kinase
MPEAKYKRILLKISGEALRGGQGSSIDNSTLTRIALQIKQVTEMGVGVGIVVGGGNIWRGAEAEMEGMDRVTADYAGMLATVINSLVLEDVLERNGVATRTMSAISLPQVAETYNIGQALKHIAKGRVVLFAGGTGNPYVTTDTAAALRAVEIHADVIVKGTRVDGVYDSDPEKNRKASMFHKISYFDVLKKDLKIMDLTAITLCKENNMPIIVFNVNQKGNLVRLVRGESVGTLVTPYSTTQTRNKVKSGKNRSV